LELSSSKKETTAYCEQICSRLAQLPKPNQTGGGRVKDSRPIHDLSISIAPIPLVEQRFLRRLGQSQQNLQAYGNDHATGVEATLLLTEMAQPAPAMVLHWQQSTNDLSFDLW